MAIDFTLTPAQQKLQRNAREFAVEILQPLVKAADQEPDTQKAFQCLKGALQTRPASGRTLTPWHVKGC